MAVFLTATMKTTADSVVFGNPNCATLCAATGPDGDYADTWAWDGERWQQIATEGPAARGMSRLAFDGADVILFGGRERTYDGFVDRNDTWLLSGSSWIRSE